MNKSILIGIMSIIFTVSGNAMAVSNPVVDSLCQKFGIQLDRNNAEKLNLIRGAARARLDELRTEYRNINADESLRFEQKFDARKKYEDAAIAYIGFEGMYLGIDIVGLNDATITRLERSLSELDTALSK